MKECVVIYNPKSGKKHGKFIDELPEVLKEYNYETVVVFTAYEKHAIDVMLGLPNTVDLVISIGGDGTFNEVVTGNLRRSKKLLLAHLPLGTANDIGAIYGYGPDVVKNLRLALEGVDKKVDIGYINDKPFVYVAGFGKFVNVSYQTPRRKKKIFGYLAYLFEAVREFFRGFKTFEAKITVDGKDYHGFYTFGLMSNANRIAGINQFYKDVKLDDGKLEFLFSNITKRKDLAKILYHYAKGDLTKASGLFYYKTDKIILEFMEKPPAWTLDGEYSKSKIRRFEIKVGGDMLLRIPKKNSKLLFEEEKD